MGVLPLRITFWDNPRLQPLLDGTVQPAGVELQWELGHPSEYHQRLFELNDVDIFEVNLVSYLQLRDRGLPAHLHWIALPIFLTRAWFQLRFEVHERAGFGDLRDLAGKRFGIPSYTMAAAVWLRVMLRQLYGIQPTDVTWVIPQRADAASAGRRNRGALPAGATVEPVHATSLSELLQQGAIDAALYLDTGALGTPGGPGTRQLLSEQAIRQIAEEFARRTGAVPLNHVVAMQARLAAERPDLPGALATAFEQAKQEAYARARRAAEGCLLFPAEDLQRQASVFGADPYPAGLAANRRSLEVLVDHLLVEHLLQQAPSLPALFLDPWQPVR